MMKKNLMLILFVGAAIVMAAGCNPMKKYEKEEQSEIDRYIFSLGDTAFVKKPSGLYYIEIVEGTGVSPVPGDSVFFWYKAKFLDNRLFDTNVNLDDPAAFRLGYGELILGIEEGLTYMKAGGKAKLLTPSPLAYGSQGIWGVLGGYTPLTWEIELVDVKSNAK